MTKDVDRTLLDNGVRIVTQRMPHVCSVSMGVWVNVGAREEAPAESGLSHMIEHMIFKGTKRRSAYQIAKAFDAIGGHTNAFTSQESTCYHAKVLNTHLGAMVDILSDIFLNSVFAQEELDREREVVLQEIRMIEDSPEDLIHNLACANLWGDHPLGRSILGTPENLAAFDAEHIRRFFHQNYQPERIVVAAAGDLEHGRIVEALAPAFGAVRAGGDLPSRLAPESRACIQAHRRPLEQVHLCLTGSGLRVTDERRYAFSLLNSIFGGNMSSRLFQTIRERLGLAYAVYSFVSSYEDSGMLGVYAAVGPKDSRKTVRCIVEQMQRLATEPVSAQQLDDAKQYTKGSLILSAESNDNQMMRLAQNEIYFGRHTSLSEVIERIDAVGASELQDLAAGLFMPERLALTLLGPVPQDAVDPSVFGG